MLKTMSLMLAVVPALLATFSAQAAQPAGWTTFQGTYFEVGVPPGFVAKPETDDAGNVNTVKLWNSKLKVEFAVFSPQWSGEAPFKQANPASEVVEDSETKKSGMNTSESLTIHAKDKSYIRFVLSQDFNDEANSSHTNKTFGIRVPDMKVYKEVRDLYLKWKGTLVQLAD